MIKIMDNRGDSSVQKKFEITPDKGALDEAIDKHRVTVRLIELLLDMPEEDQRNILKALEYEQAQKQVVSEKKKASPENLRERNYY